MALEGQGDDTKIIGMSSAEAEAVSFVTPIALKDAPKVHQWLTAVENSMRSTLAACMRDCVAEAVKLPPMSAGNDEGAESYKKWIRYMLFFFFARL